MAKRSFLDRLLGRKAPAARRVRAFYEGASVGKRTSGWRRKTSDANSGLNAETQRRLRGVARDLVRNNPFAHRGVSKVAEAIVGTGITFQVYRDGVIDDRLNQLARAHLDKPTCDAGGRLDLYGLQLLAATAIVESGAALVRRRWRRVSDGLPLPFQIQVLEPDYLVESKDGPLGRDNNGYLVNGVQFSPFGKREGYWLYAGHPGARRSATLEARFVPASEVAHLFRVDRPEQEHGASWLAPVIVRLKDFGDYEDAQLTRQKIASAFAAFIKAEDSGGGVPGIVEDEEAGLDDAGERIDYVEPGTVNYLRPGEEVTFPDPPGVDGYSEYSKVSLRAVAVGLGVPYEVLTGDLSNVSFISGRLGSLQYRDTVARWQWLMFIPQFCGAVERWLLEALETVGEDVAGVTLRWTPPPTRMLDPATEVAANRDAVRSGQATVSSLARERGEDPDTFLAEWAADMRKLDELGIILDCDPRKVTSQGNAANLNGPEARRARETP